MTADAYTKSKTKETTLYRSVDVSLDLDSMNSIIHMGSQGSIKGNKQVYNNDVTLTSFDGIISLP